MSSRWNRLGLQLRIMVYVTIGLVVLFGGLAYFGMRAVREASGQVFHERTALAQSLAQAFDEELSELSSHVKLTAESLTLTPQDFARGADRLFRTLALYASGHFFTLSSLHIVDGEGRLLAAAPADEGGAWLPAAEEVQKALELKRTLVLRSQAAPRGSVPFASLVVPVSAPWTGDQPMAVVVDTVVPSNVRPAMPGGEGIYSMEVLAADGMTIVSTDRPEEVGKKSFHHAQLHKFMDVGRSGAEVHHMPEGALVEDHVAAVAPFPSGPFFLVLEQPADLALAVPRRLQNQILVVSAVGILVALVAAWYTTRAVVRPVGQLRAAARGIAEGGLDSPVQVSAQDEVGQLAEDIETMRHQLKRARDDLEQAKSDLERKVAERTQRLHETLGKVIRAQEEERLRLARELHDETSQALGALSVSLDRLSKLLGQPSPQAQGELEQARAMARSLLQETRRLIYDLRPSVLDDMGLEAAIRWSAETHLQRHGVEVTISHSLDSGRLPPPVEVALFRVAQEAIVNIERHAQARHAAIVLEQRGSSLGMQVRDDGRGFDPSRIGNRAGASGAGLEGMQERVHLLGGRMEIISAPGKGTVIKVEVPLE